MDESLRVEAVAFLDGFVAAFATFRGEEVARRYAPPFLAVDARGGATAFATEADVAHHFQGVLDDYRARGCRSCRYVALEAVAIGAQAALVSATWELLRADGAAELRWRESYAVRRTERGMRVLASFDHAE